VSCSFRRLLFCAVISGLMFSTAVSAHGEESRPPQCSSGMLDVSLVSPVKASTERDSHLLAVEIRNRSDVTCFLPKLVLKFPPEDSEQSGDPRAPDSSQAALAFKQKSQRLAVGEVVHFVLVWSSVPLYSKEVVMNDCSAHDTMTFYWDSVYEKKPSLEVRHLWMQTCGQFWRSSYRLGPYVPGEPIAKEWLERNKLKSSDFTTQIVLEPERSIAAAHAPITLRPLYEIEYLKGTFESGYSGYFEMFLKVPSQAISNCPFDSLSKREADGQTVVHLNHCQNHRTQSDSTGTPKEIRLLIRELGLLPERPGRVEYNVTSEVLYGSKVTQARARAEVDIRNPMQPMLPEIDTSTPGCQSSQLKALSPPVNLGSHWAEPRAYAPPGEEWHDGKVYEVKNVSSQSCMLGGMPELKFLNPPEVTSGSLLPRVCRNCPTPLFQPRESRWIELNPNDSVHFMVARTVFDADYWFECIVIGGLELNLPGDKPIRLPFETGSCGPVHVSAWRAGPYDADPMNIKYDRREKERDEQREAAAKLLPKECRDSVSADTGRPVMLPSGGALTWGLSTKPMPFGEAVPVLLWFYNPTDKPQPVWTCQDIDWFWQDGIDVFDSSGHRLLSRAEEEIKKTPGSEIIRACTRNFPIDIPPRSCAHGSFSKPEYDFERDLQRYYSLPPGRYLIVPAERTKDYKPVTRTMIDPKIGLRVTVQEQ